MYNNVLYNDRKYTAYSKKFFGEAFQSSSFTVQFPRNSYVEIVNCEAFWLKSPKTAHSLKSEIIKQHQQQVSIQNVIVMLLVLPFLPFLPVMLVLPFLLVLPILLVLLVIYEPSTEPNLVTSSELSEVTTSAPPSAPSLVPLSKPSHEPSEEPSAAPSSEPSEETSKEPSSAPSSEPSPEPTCKPLYEPPS